MRGPNTAWEPLRNDLRPAARGRLRSRGIADAAQGQWTPAVLQVVLIKTRRYTQRRHPILGAAGKVAKLQDAVRAAHENGEREVIRSPRARPRQRSGAGR